MRYCDTWFLYDRHLWHYGVTRPEGQAYPNWRVTSTACSFVYYFIIFNCLTLRMIYANALWTDWWLFWNKHAAQTLAAPLRDPFPTLQPKRRYVIRELNPISECTLLGVWRVEEQRWQQTPSNLYKKVMEALQSSLLWMRNGTLIVVRTHFRFRYSHICC